MNNSSLYNLQNNVMCNTDVGFYENISGYFARGYRQTTQSSQTKRSSLEHSTKCFKKGNTDHHIWRTKFRIYNGILEENRTPDSPKLLKKIIDNRLFHVFE